MSTRRVTYQPLLGPAAPRDTFEELTPGDLRTRRRDAVVRVPVALSREQADWLDAAARAGADRDAIVRALVDVGRALHVDWGAVTGRRGVRDAVRHAVRVRRASPPEG